MSSILWSHSNLCINCSCIYLFWSEFERTAFQDLFCLNVTLRNDNVWEGSSTRLVQVVARRPATGEDQEYVLVGLRPFSVEFEITAFLSPIGEISGIKSAVEDKPQKRGKVEFNQLGLGVGPAPTNSPVLECPHSAAQSGEAWKESCKIDVTWHFAFVNRRCYLAFKKKCKQMSSLDMLDLSK